MKMYYGLTEAQRDAAQAYAAEHGLAFQSSGSGDDTVSYSIGWPPTDPGAPEWTDQAISELEAVMADAG